jgi:GNAT superfamily N-acetyltransferase
VNVPLTFRPGVLDDSLAIFQVFQEALLDLSQRTGVMAVTGGNDPDVLAQMWERRRPLWEHLARTADHFWIAEKDGQVVGYARSILRDGVRELTEFFVRPGEQSAGVGRELIARAFPVGGAKHRLIVATNDVRALARYHKAGVYARIPEYLFARTPEAVSVPTDLSVEPMATESLETVNAIDAVVLGHRRDVDQVFLMSERPGYVYRRGGEVVGYGYVAKDWQGPFAVLHPSDFPAVLAHAETQAHALGAKSVGFEVPLINRVVVDYLLERGYQLDGFLGSIMSDEPFGKFENYLLTSPPFFL